VTRTWTPDCQRLRRCRPRQRCCWYTPKASTSCGDEGVGEDGYQIHRRRRQNPLLARKRESSWSHPKP